MDDTPAPALTAEHNKHDRIWLVHPDHHDVEWTAEDPALDDDPDMSGTHQVYVRGDLYDALAAQLAAETAARVTVVRERDAARTQRDAALARASGAEALGRQMAGVIEETWQFAYLWAENYARERGAKMHAKHAGILARVHAAVTAAHAAGYLRKVITSELPAILSKHGHDIAAMLPTNQHATVPREMAVRLAEALHQQMHGDDGGRPDGYALRVLDEARSAGLLTEGGDHGR